MKTKWKMLTLAALLSAGTTAANAADNGYGDEYGDDAYFSETSDYVGGLYDEDAAAPTQTKNTRRNRVVDDAAHQPAALEPVTYVGDSQPYENYHSGYEVGSSMAMDSGSYGCQSGDCGQSHGGGSCGTACQPMRTPIANQTGAWLTAEALLWFPQVRSTVPLVSSNVAGGSNELDAGAGVAFGGDDAFGGELQAGFRLDAGLMLSDDFGIGGRFWMLGETEDKFSRNGDGTTGSFGIPFFDSDLVANQENALDILLSDGPGPLDDFAGSIDARSALSMYAAEAYGRLRLLGGKGYRSDFVGGFSHFGIDEELSLVANTTQTSGAGAGINTILREDISAENRFYGGQLGFLTTVGRGAWSLSALTKVHLGNMDQSWTDRGSRQRVGTPAVAGGLFANAPERTYDSSNFAFAPEANVKLTYKMTNAIRFSVGYSFIMWDDVLLIGDNLNRSINGTYLEPDAGGAVEAAERPLFTGLKTDSFFVHGIDLGAVIQF